MGSALVKKAPNNNNKSDDSHGNHHHTKEGLGNETTTSNGPTRRSRRPSLLVAGMSSKVELLGDIHDGTGSVHSESSTSYSKVSMNSDGGIHSVLVVTEACEIPQSIAEENETHFEDESNEDQHKSPPNSPGIDEEDTYPLSPSTDGEPARGAHLVAFNMGKDHSRTRIVTDSVEKKVHERSTASKTHPLNAKDSSKKASENKMQNGFLRLGKSSRSDDEFEPLSIASNI